jgi:hypothetical protein
MTAAMISAGVRPSGALGQTASTAAHRGKPVGIYGVGLSGLFDILDSDFSRHRRSLSQ